MRNNGSMCSSESKLNIQSIYVGNLKENDTWVYKCVSGRGWCSLVAVNAEW